MDANWRSSSGPDWALAYCYVFRRIAFATCLAAAGIGWALHIDWLLASAICIGIGEVLETTYYIVVMRWGRARLQSSNAAVAKPTT
jgi:hypothetical protein